MTNLWAGLLMSAALVGCSGETPQAGSTGGAGSEANSTSGSGGDAATGGGDVQLGDPGNIDLGTPATTTPQDTTGATGTGSPADSSTEGPVLPAPKETPPSP